MIEVQAAPFDFEVSPADVADLVQRVERFRIPPFASDATSMGIGPTTLERVLGYWRQDFDWYQVQARVNALPNRRATIDGEQQLHFLDARTGGPDADVIVLLNGWPSTPLGWSSALDHLAGSAAAPKVDVIAPTMPGFTLSGPTIRTGWSPARIAAAYSDLMSALGIESYFVAGSDFGSMVAMNLAAVDPGRVIGLHLGTAPLMRNYARAESGRPPRWIDDADLTDDDRARLRHDADRFRASAPQRGAQIAIPHTIGAALEDSPVGLLAWFYGPWLDRQDEILDTEIERIIADTCLYWFTRTVTSSLRMYREVADAGSALVPRQPTVPTGVRIAEDDVAHTPRRWVERHYNIVYWDELAAGGHFAEVHAPEAFASSIRRFIEAVHQTTDATAR
jgi:pimeloyl-ACP methyl ester carboxylesterase